MKKKVAYFVIGAVLLYILFRSNKPKDKDKTGEKPDDDTTSVDDVIRESRDFTFFYKQEQDAFNTAYKKRYSVNEPAPKDGDLLVVEWAIPERNLDRKSTFQYRERMWRRFSNFAKIQNSKNQKWLSLKTQK